MFDAISVAGRLKLTTWLLTFVHLFDVISVAGRLKLTMRSTCHSSTRRKRKLKRLMIINKLTKI
jgi:hypothetical protein